MGDRATLALLLIVIGNEKETVNILILEKLKGTSNGVEDFFNRAQKLETDKKKQIVKFLKS